MISCVWIRSARSGAFFIRNIVVFLQIQILQIRLPKVFPAGMCDSCQQTCRSHETELFRNTAKHGADKKNISVGENPADPLSVTDLKEQFDFLETGSLFLIFMLR